MSLGVWLEQERKCSATVVALDLLLIKNTTEFIKSVFKTLVRVKDGISLRGNGMWHACKMA